MLFASMVCMDKTNVLLLLIFYRLLYFYIIKFFILYNIIFYLKMLNIIQVYKCFNHGSKLRYRSLNPGF